MEVALLLLVVVGVNAWQTRDLRRKELPAFALPTLAGDEVMSASFRGKRTMLVVWAPWCGVCAAESQNVSWVRSLVGEHANVASLATHYDDLTEVRAFVGEHEVDYPVLLGGRQGARLFGIRSFPTLLFIDEHGWVTGASIGYTTTLGMLVRLLL